MVKVKPKFLILFLMLFGFMQFTYAYDFTINEISGPISKPYQGQTVDSLTSSITMADNTCKLTCYWETESYGGLDNQEGLIGISLISGQTKNFGFKVEAKGTAGYTSTVLTVKCRGEQAWNCYPWPSTPNIETRTKQVNFNFDYNGDSACTTRDNLESCVNAKSDCACSQYKSCIDDKGDQSRNDLDERKCATYCGNKVIEKPYEICSNCPNDVGKCDGLQCFTGSECEGKFCVHNKCSPLAYVLGDTFCDKNEGENCKNSGSDCACSSNERCNPSGFCETYCGNNICEESEKGKCKLDCTWCGDGTCQQSESCSSCSDDCGVCKKVTKEEELQRNIPKTSSVETESQKTSSGITSQRFQFKNNKSILIISIIVVVVIGIAILSYWLVKRKKGHKSKENVHCPKCHKKTDSQGKFCHHCGHKLK